MTLALKVLGLVLIAAILAIVARVTLGPDVRPYGTGRVTRVPAGTVEKQTGPYVMANYSAYQGGAPRLGDIVVVQPPVGRGMVAVCGSPPPPGAMCATPLSGYGLADYVNRVVGLPGDRLSLRGGRVVRNGRPLDEPYARPCTGVGCDFPRTITVQPDSYFALADDRRQRADSRRWGAVPRKAVLARVDDCIPLIRLFCHAKT
jgi:signal peptidase I